MIFMGQDMAVPHVCPDDVELCTNPYISLRADQLVGRWYPDRIFLSPFLGVYGIR